MKPHKHAELIKAWADGAEIQVKVKNCVDGDYWIDDYFPYWNDERYEYRIKHIPKAEPVKVYYYIYNNAVDAKTWFSPIHLDYPDSITCQYIGKIEVFK